MAERIQLRAWQRAALHALSKAGSRDFLAVATPGAGKTTFALVAARRAFVAGAVRRLVVVVPTQHLKLQWTHAAERFGIVLDPEWSARDGGLPSDVHGAVVTYQQVAANPGVLRGLVRQAFVILDEIHHAAETRSWGDGIRHAFEHAPRRLCLSGTPFRSDQSAIPFVRYEGEEAEADYEYGYGQALMDRSVVRPVYFPRINGRMEWTATDGTTWSAGFDDPLGRTRASQRLRTALDLGGEWIPGVLGKAHRQLLHLRQSDARAGGMVIAMDQDHARGIARLLRERVGAAVTVATSDDPRASKKIERFAESDAPWIVAVRMVSEGVDIPRLRVGVYATHTVTDLFFRQAVGRLVRHTSAGELQRAYMFIPDDPRLRDFALRIAEHRRHSLRRPQAGPDDEGELARLGSDDPSEGEAPAEQMSLFTAISAVPLEADGAPLAAEKIVEEHEHEIPDLVADVDEARQAGAHSGGPSGEDAFELTAPGLDEELPAPEPLPGQEGAQPSVHSRKRSLREQNSARVRMLVHLTRRTHAEINAGLNREVGIGRITGASVTQLERRLAVADRWLADRRLGRG